MKLLRASILFSLFSTLGLQSAEIPEYKKPTVLLNLKNSSPKTIALIIEIQFKIQLA